MTDAAAFETAETDPRWSLARDLFAAGETGAEVCRRLDLSPSTFWARANCETWLRRDKPVADPPEDEPLDLEGEVEDLDAVLNIAWRYLCRALKRGSSAEAARRDRLHARLEARVAARADAERRRGRDSIDHALAVARQVQDDVETTLAAMDRRRALKSDLEKVESKNPDSSPGPAPLDPNAPGLSRAERRRRLAYLAKRR